MNCNDVICSCGQGKNRTPDNLIWKDGLPYCPNCNNF